MTNIFDMGRHHGDEAQRDDSQDAAINELRAEVERLRREANALEAEQPQVEAHKALDEANTALLDARAIGGEGRSVDVADKLDAAHAAVAQAANAVDGAGGAGVMGPEEAAYEPYGAAGGGAADIGAVPTDPTQTPTPVPAPAATTTQAVGPTEPQTQPTTPAPTVAQEANPATVPAAPALPAATPAGQPAPTSTSSAPVLFTAPVNAEQGERGTFTVTVEHEGIDPDKALLPIMCTPNGAPSNYVGFTVAETRKGALDLHVYTSDGNAPNRPLELQVAVL